MDLKVWPKVVGVGRTLDQKMVFYCYFLLLCCSSWEILDCFPATCGTFGDVSQLRFVDSDERSTMVIVTWLEAA